MRTYHATATRGAKYWLVHVLEIERTTQARRLSEVEEMARDLIAVLLDVPIASFEVEVEVRLPEAVRTHLARSLELRTQAATAQADAAAEVRAAARQLHQLGLPLRDIGVALGVSYQRAHQLVSNSNSGRR